MATATGGRGRLMFCVAVVLAGSACSTRIVREPNLAARTSYTAMTPSTAPRYALAPSQSAVAPLPSRLFPPTYPAALVRSGARPVTVVVQLAVNGQGRVYAVYPVSNTAAKAQAIAFEMAVEEAVSRWEFTPLWIVTTGAGGADHMVAKSFSLWYAFHFSVVDGKPSVQTAKR